MVQIPVVQAVAGTHLTQTHTYFHELAGGVVARMFLSHQRVDPLPNFHNHEGEQIIVALEGESRLEIVRGHGTPQEHTVDLPIREGDIAVLSARKPHRWITRHGELLALAIDLCESTAPARTGNPNREDFESMLAVLMGTGEPEVLPGMVKSDETFSGLVRSYREEAELKRPGFRTRIGALSTEMLVRLARLHANAVPQRLAAQAAVAAQGGVVPIRLSPRHYVERAREYLHSDYRRAIALPELAERVGLSVTHLHRLFVGQLQMPPMAYLRQYRLERARELLAQTARPVRAIAKDVGYPEPERFCKAFRRAFGNSPRQFRQTALRQGLPML